MANNRKEAGNDQHHIFFRRNLYKGKLKILREHPYCKVYIPKNTLHKEIHGRMLWVPPPSPAALDCALYQLKMLEGHAAIDEEDTFEERLLLLAALFDCSAQPTADALREQYRIALEFKKAP